MVPHLEGREDLSIMVGASIDQRTFGSRCHGVRFSIKGRKRGLGGGFDIQVLGRSDT